MFDSETPLLEDVDNVTPDAALGVLLSTVERSELSGDDRVALMRARARLVAHFEALLLADMVSVADAVEELDEISAAFHFQTAAAEIGAALHLTRRAAEERLSFATALRRRLPAVWRALARGRLDVRRALVIEHGTCHLDEPTARRVADEILEVAEGLTTGQIAARLRRICIDEDRHHARQRYETAIEERRIVVQPTVDGTAHLLGLHLPPDRVAAVSARINHLAKKLRRAGETRSMDQLRADVLLDLLDGTGGGSGGVVEIRVDLTTLAELDGHPGDLAGFGPVIAEIARRVTDRYRSGSWRFAVTHPDSDQSPVTGVVRRRPDAAQRRSIWADHPTCIFPGCRMPARASDLDHRVPWSRGGPTTVSNLAPLCRHHHMLKDNTPWSYVPAGHGDHRWTSPLRRHYTTSGRSP